MKARILVVDDEPDMLQACAEALEGLDVQVVTEGSGPQALERLRDGGWDMLVSDINIPAVNGLELMRAAAGAPADIAVVLMTAYPKLDSAVEALRHGAADYVIKPFHPDVLASIVERVLRERALARENVLLRRRVEKPHLAAAILGGSPAVQEMLHLLDRVAPLDAEVLLLGESGTGKELAARRIHAKSGRPGRFVALDCGAIPENLLENELFGHEKGAFTDAGAASSGLLEFADRGTLFLDELCEMPFGLQSKLLRTLQERQFRRVGGQRLISVDVRLVAATNKDINEEVARGRFRSDLYYRVNALQVRLPPLRERAGDAALLAADFLKRFAAELGRPVKGISREAAAVLARCRWPGNVRELENAIKRAVALCDGTEISIDDLPEAVALEVDEGGGPGGFAAERDRVLAQFEARYLGAVMERRRGDARSAAAEARIPLSTFYRLLKKHGIG